MAISLCKPKATAIELPIGSFGGSDPVREDRASIALSKSTVADEP